MNEVTPFLGVLSGMITPAVLILASGSLIMTTSQRLSRAIDRVRKIADEFVLIEQSHDKESASEKKRRILYTLLNKSAQRSKLLTRAMIFLYIALGTFVATSLAIGVVAIAHLRFTWIPTALGMVGAICLFYSSSILILESRLTFHVVKDEVDFAIESSRTRAPEGMERKEKWKRKFRM